MTARSKRFPGVEWTGGTGDFVRVDPDRCNGCADCMRVCLGGCFTVEKKKARVVSLAECMECGSCWYICERGAILFSWPKGGTGFRTRFG
jgi:NAD-dependent dihydropyrimidine dehydrogenase PreA subunit